MGAKTTYRLGVDIDNVVANSSKRALQVLSEARRIDPPLERSRMTGYPFDKCEMMEKAGITQKEIGAAIDKAWIDHWQEVELMDQKIPSITAELIAEGVLVLPITTMGERQPEVAHPILPRWFEHVGFRYTQEEGHNMFVDSAHPKESYNVETIPDDQLKVGIGLAKPKVARKVAGGEVLSARPGMLYAAPWNLQYFEPATAAAHDPRIVLPGQPNPLTVTSGSGEMPIFAVRDWTDIRERVFELRDREQAVMEAARA